MTSQKKKLITDTLIYFSKVFSKEITNELIETYYSLLKDYPEEDIKEASFLSLEELIYFPKPKEIIERIRSVQKTRSEDLRLKENDILQHQTCTSCGKPNTMVIKPDLICRQCYSGLSTEDYKQKVRDMVERIGKKP
jgi:hypothetical protein